MNSLYLCRRAIEDKLEVLRSWQGMGAFPGSHNIPYDATLCDHSLHTCGESAEPHRWFLEPAQL